MAKILAVIPLIPEWLLPGNGCGKKVPLLTKALLPFLKANFEAKCLRKVGNPL